MNKILCFVSDEMADFEITLVFHKLKTIGNKEIITVGYDLTPVVSESGLTYLPNRTIEQVLDLPGVEALIIPGGPIRSQRDKLTELILKLDNEKRLLAAICNGPPVSCFVFPHYLSPRPKTEIHPNVCVSLTFNG